VRLGLHGLLPFVLRSRWPFGKLARRSADPTSYYFRMNPMFETSSKKYDWMNRIIAVGTGDRLPDGPVYNIFEVL
jgi:hypothetical protein